GAEVDAHSSSGDVTLGLLDFLKNVTVNTSSGNADISAPGTSSFALDFSTGSGSSKIEFPITFTTQDKHALSGNVGTGGPKLHVQTSSGSFSLLKK
ncbi:MAG: DUF4097 family beta strand repeat-containing protein, partial [Tumebacillaceae bacterium]